ncbi:unnamed protein product [Cylindrotheca closterium]|uniref:Uncharacterized protein n=1 Tax=Cylindrotheca closterium TaxID=2856 RepID=A0AAD2CN50_9STRA|nr:unnamed protein product [Cylindrotheca closterium]
MLKREVVEKSTAIQSIEETAMNRLIREKEITNEVIDSRNRLIKSMVMKIEDRNENIERLKHENGKLMSIALDVEMNTALRNQVAALKSHVVSLNQQLQETKYVATTYKTEFERLKNQLANIQRLESSFTCPDIGRVAREGSWGSAEWKRYAARLLQDRTHLLGTIEELKQSAETNKSGVEQQLRSILQEFKENLDEVETSLSTARQAAKAHAENNQQLVAENEDLKHTISKMKENHYSNQAETSLNSARQAVNIGCETKQILVGEIEQLKQNEKWNQVKASFQSAIEKNERLVAENEDLKRFISNMEASPHSTTQRNERLIAKIEELKQTMSKMEENHSEEMEQIQEEMNQIKMDHAMAVGLAQSDDDDDDEEQAM